MSKHIDICMTGPPALDFPSYVGAQDESGQPVSVGRWLPPDDDSPCWRLRLTAAELLMYMIADTEQITGQPCTPVSIAMAGGQLPAARTRPASARAALKAKLGNAKPRTSPSEPPLPDPALTEPCPACRAKFNPSSDQLVDCSSCGESKCSAKCYDNIAEPCLDCKALVADPNDPDEVAFEPPTRAKISDPVLAKQVEGDQQAAARAVSSRLFDNTFHGKGGDSAAADDEEE